MLWGPRKKEEEEEEEAEEEERRSLPARGGTSPGR